MPRNPSPHAGPPTDKRAVTPETMRRDDRLEEALRLRRYGFNYQQIADTPWPDGPDGTLYGGDRHNARRAIVNARNDTIREAADEVRQFEVERLDMILVGLADKGLFEGNVQVVNAAMPLMARRAKLLGLDAPTQIESTGDGVINVSFTDKLKPSGGMAEPELDVDLPDA
ncbi:helix-turn-helix DNA binding domain protein [Arthrobacter phage Jinkies]|uniref:Helix-turn-helix DNA binding domain protein n=1 Tax=Arthrobacter phage Jinkies TaxID=2743903 RepID=A0A7S5WRZ0_9CAUD|nr:helix-turn-helix DNA binding domain protein [Arthrobacter phage Jinkies]